MKPVLYLIQYTKIKSKWIKNLNIRPETITLLQENTGNKLFDISLSDIFLDQAPQATAIKAKIDKGNHIKLKSFCTVKKTINKMKIEPTG